jgi:vacuolar-type H+-ATPase subunit I/STV1
MSLESPTTVRDNLLSVIQTTPEADLPELLAIVRDFQQRTLDRNPAQIQWQKAVDAINTQDAAKIEQRKANISKLIATLKEDDDIEEQQQALADIRSIAYRSKTR